jgi:hypothetical protein
MSKPAAAAAETLPDLPREVEAFADLRVPDLVMRPERTLEVVSFLMRVPGLPCPFLALAFVPPREIPC